MTSLLCLRDLAVCFGAVFLYGIFMSAPRKALFLSALSGAVAYFVYRLLAVVLHHELIGYFAAAFLAAASAELFARFFRMPATVFVMPSLIPLVPGIGLYRSMLCLVQNDLDGFLAAGTRTVLISGIIAAAVAVTNSAARHILRRKPAENTEE